jgi:hypothetical protein
VWVRAVVLVVWSLVLLSALCVLGATELAGAGSHRSLGGPVLKIDMLLIFLTVFLGPAWVIAPKTRPPGGGPPRGGIVPLRLETPEPVDGAGEDESPPAAA